MRLPVRLRRWNPSGWAGLSPNGLGRQKPHHFADVLIGSNLANNQPVFMKYLYEAKRNGTNVAVVNPYLEPGLERYWVPSSAESALFGTRVCDLHVPVRPGGDAAFCNAVLKVLVDLDAVDNDFIAAHTEGWDSDTSPVAGSKAAAAWTEPVVSNSDWRVRTAAGTVASTAWSGGPLGASGASRSARSSMDWWPHSPQAEVVVPSLRVGAGARPPVSTSTTLNAVSRADPVVQ